MVLGLFMLHLVPAGQVLVSRNQACSAFIGQIRPGPLNQNDQAIAETDQEKYVNRQPRQPGKKTGDVNLSEIGYRGGAPDCGQTPFVPIVEGLSWLSFQFSGDVVGCGFAFLNCDSA